MTMAVVPVQLPDHAGPGAVVELYRQPDGTMAASVRVPAPVPPGFLDQVRWGLRYIKSRYARPGDHG